MQSLGWNRTAVISSRHPSFVDSTCAFLKEQGIQITTHLETFLSPTEYLQELQRFGIKIIVALNFVPQSGAVDILLAAYLMDSKWPDYAWIFTTISKPISLNDYCQVETINNVIFLHLLASAKFNPQDMMFYHLNSIIVPTMKCILKN